MKIVHEFCDHAWSKINVSKTECLLFVRLKNTFTEINGICDTKEMYYILRVKPTSKCWLFTQGLNHVNVLQYVAWN